MIEVISKSKYQESFEKKTFLVKRIENMFFSLNNFCFLHQITRSMSMSILIEYWYRHFRCLWTYPQCGQLPLRQEALLRALDGAERVGGGGTDFSSQLHCLGPGGQDGEITQTTVSQSITTEQNLSNYVTVSFKHYLTIHFD